MIAVLAALSLPVAATQARDPPISADRLLGTWEGIVADEGRVVMVNVGQGRTTAATGVLRGPLDPMITTFSIEKTDVANGRVTWEGRSSDLTNYRVRISGVGTEGNGYGRITAKVNLMNRDGRKVIEWSTTLIGRQTSYSSGLARLMEELRQKLNSKP